MVEREGWGSIDRLWKCDAVPVDHSGQSIRANFSRHGLSICGPVHDSRTNCVNEIITMHMYARTNYE